VTFVASAGNDATWRKQYPAALPKVIAVGAIGPMGPAWFTNYGPWVNACAPGVGVLSTFFTNWNGATPMQPNGLDPDDYNGWAYWSGTSFSAPVVVGNLARLMMGGATVKEAINRLINEQALARMPYLGTVVDAL
jgi:subtilisin family serine protease